MKSIKHYIGRLMVGCVFACCLPFLSPQAFAIEGLQVSVQSSNVVLAWPSDSSETYIIQYRHRLNADDAWTNLADYYPADSDTNVTYFTDSSSADFGWTTNSGSGTGFYRVVRDGAHLYGITNGMVLSGIVRLPVELANGSGTVSTMSLTENDSPVGSSIQTAPLAAPLALIVDTTQMANGDHQVSASARWEDTNGGIWEADSPPITVTVANEVSFENWMPQFGELGNSLLIRATSAHPDTDWYIDVYDSTYTYIGTFGGHTYDGDISVTWDLIGPNGAAHTNDNFFIFKVSTDYIDPPTPKTFRHWEKWSGHGAWVAVAQHAWNNYHDVDLLYGELGGFIGGALGQHWPVLPSPQGQNDYGSYLAYGLTFDSGGSQGDTDWQNFRNALYDARSRNLVYFGHGGPNGLGHDLASTNRSISATEIGNRLHTIPIGQTNSHSFRFVFLDGCSTAKGNLPEAFGMIHRENVKGQDYSDAAMRYSAFVGWPEDKMIGFLQGGGYINYDHVNFIAHIQTDMLLNGATIKAAIIYAARQPDVHGFNEDSMKVYGFWDLTFGLQN